MLDAATVRAAGNVQFCRDLLMRNGHQAIDADRIFQNRLQLLPSVGHVAKLQFGYRPLGMVFPIALSINTVERRGSGSRCSGWSWRWAGPGCRSRSWCRCCCSCCGGRRCCCRSMTSCWRCCWSVSSSRCGCGSVCCRWSGRRCSRYCRSWGGSCLHHHSACGELGSIVIRISGGCGHYMTGRYGHREIDIDRAIAIAGSRYASETDEDLSLAITQWVTLRVVKKFYTERRVRRAI